MSVPRSAILRCGLVVGLRVVEEDVLRPEAAPVQPQEVRVEKHPHEVPIVRGGAVLRKHALVAQQTDTIL